MEWNEYSAENKGKNNINNIVTSTLNSGDGYIYRIFDSLHTLCVGELKLPSFNVIDAPPFLFHFIWPMNEWSWLVVDCYFVTYCLMVPVTHVYSVHFVNPLFNPMDKVACCADPALAIFFYRIFWLSIVVANEGRQKVYKIHPVGTKQNISTTRSHERSDPVAFCWKRRTSNLVHRPLECWWRAHK